MTFFAIPSAPAFGSTVSCKNFEDARAFGKYFPNGFAVYCELPRGERVLVYAHNYLAHGAGDKRISKELDMTEANLIHKKWFDSL